MRQYGIKNGISRIVEDPGLLPSATIGLCSNYAATAPDLGRGVDALVAAGLPISTLLTPEHGYWGAAQAGESDGDGIDESTQLPVIDTYGTSGGDLEDRLTRAEVDQVVLDLQDIGTRFYTYIWTLYDLLIAAARTGQRIVVLDRPNPLGGRRAGPGLDASCSSFIGRVSIPLQHGLTLGELARWFNTEHVPAATGGSADLTVIPVEGWRRERQPANEPWVMPSPNLPTIDTAVLYPATGLLEGTTLSEGRGTTRPFELFGAPWTDRRLATALREQDLPGVSVREAVFRPTFSTWAGETVHGAQLHLLDAGTFDPVTTAITILLTVADLYPSQELWREAGPGRPPFIDFLWGSSSLRGGIDDRATPAEILATSPTAPHPPDHVQLYPTEEAR